MDGWREGGREGDGKNLRGGVSEGREGNDFWEWKDGKSKRGVGATCRGEETKDHQS